MKRELRKEMIQRRSALSKTEAKQKTQKIHQVLLRQESVKRAQSILVYLNFGDEIDTRPVIDLWLRENRRIYVPVMKPKTRILVPVRIDHGFRELPVNSFGIQEPPLEGAETALLEELDLVIVPGLAFDQAGNRLGYGGGYYDRLLPQLRFDASAIAMGYAFQVIDQVPVGLFDYPIQTLITECWEDDV
jgi:5-formyltetrahydrofolate cyclo-ligase